MRSVFVLTLATLNAEYERQVIFTGKNKVKTHPETISDLTFAFNNTIAKSS